jgi:hypothetical protein
MAGSYKHIKRATKPTDNTAKSYGGLDTSLVEDMGDAIEAMTHMWWMIWLLAGGDTAKIKAVYGPAMDIEVGKVPPPDLDPTDDDDDEFPMMPGIGLGPNQIPPAEKPAPLPTDWQPTMYLRFVRRMVEVNGAATSRFILQQGYVHADGNRIWVDVPTVEEGT